MTQGALACYLNIEPPAVSKSLVKLEQKKLIVRITGHDKREKKVALTAEAVAQYQTWEKMVGHHRQAILSDLSETQQREMTMLLKTIFQNAQRYDQNGSC